MRRYREIKEVEGRLPFLRFSRKVKDRQKQNEYMSIHHLHGVTRLKDTFFLGFGKSLFEKLRYSSILITENF